jgi:hypothetical protein
VLQLELGDYVLEHDHIVLEDQEMELGVAKVIDTVAVDRHIDLKNSPSG